MIKMKIGSKFLFCREEDERSQYVHARENISTLLGKKAHFKTVHINNLKFCGKTTSQYPVPSVPVQALTFLQLLAHLTFIVQPLNPNVAADGWSYCCFPFHL
jgi:hypothetical protein